MSPPTIASCSDWGLAFLVVVLKHSTMAQGKISPRVSEWFFKMKRSEKKPHPIKEVLSDFDHEYFKVIGVRAPIVPGKDAKLAQGLLGKYSREQLCGWYPVFFSMRDDFIENSGYTFAVFCGCIGKVIAACQLRTRPAVSKKTEQTLRGIYGD